LERDLTVQKCKFACSVLYFAVLICSRGPRFKTTFLNITTILRRIRLNKKLTDTTKKIGVSSAIEIRSTNGVRTALSDHHDSTPSISNGTLIERRTLPEPWNIAAP